MRLVKGEDRCIYCGYKLPSKLRRQLAEEQSTTDGVSPKSNEAVRRFELDELEHEKAIHKEFRRAEGKYLRNMLLFFAFFVSGIVLIAIIASNN